MRFCIRDLLLVTTIVALALGWCLDRGRLASRAAELESYRALTEALTLQLQDQNPAAEIKVSVNGEGVLTSRTNEDFSESIVEVRKSTLSPSTPTLSKP